jgi:hypothetical protein
MADCFLAVVRNGLFCRRECCPRGRGAARVVDTFGDLLLVSAVS